jgi:hypothetical protein
MPYHLAGQVTFASTGDRNRASRAVGKLLSDWNSTHDASQDFTQVRLANTNIGGLVALDFEYTCLDQESVEMAHQAIHFDVDSNAYVELLGLSIWLD